MKASELRLNNYVNYQIGTSMFQGKVTTITKTRIVVGDVTSKFMNIQPIPLTEEWLLKFGFKKDLGNDLYLDSTSTSFFIWQNNRVELLDDKNNICISHCEYVHQLQNLYFALTGQELIIK